jgi:glycine/D-amino acid oxidase-like deaminating enzyme
VVGAGALSVAAAYYLTLDGWQVTVVDRGEVGGGCSYANACLIVPSHAPLAGPGVLSQGSPVGRAPGQPGVCPAVPSPGDTGLGHEVCARLSGGRAPPRTQALRTLARRSLELFDALPEPIQQAFRVRSGLLDAWVGVPGCGVNSGAFPRGVLTGRATGGFPSG